MTILGPHVTSHSKLYAGWGDNLTIWITGKQKKTSSGFLKLQLQREIVDKDSSFYMIQL